MAEEFVIRVQVENLQGRSAAPRTGSNAQQNTGTGLGDTSLAEVEQRGRIQTYRPINFADFSYDERMTKRGVGQVGRIGSDGISDLQDYEFRNLGLQKFGTVRQAQLVDPNMVGPPEAPFTQETMFGAGARQTGNFLNQHRARVRATTTIAANSALRAGIAIKNHRSGDSYRNEQRQLMASAGSQLASIGIAGAVWGGTAAIAFALSAGIGGATSMIIENANFKYDRMMDTHYIHNTKQVAGDISYGRNRRGGN